MFRISILFFTLLTLSLTASPVQAAKLTHSPGLMTGEKAPDFTAVSHEGETVTLSEMLKQGPVVLIFYRGAWCPYCNLHLKQFQDNIDNIKSFGASVLGVSIDQQSYGEKTVIKNSLGFQVLSDSNAEILENYNLIFQVPDELASKYKNEYGIDLEAHSGRTDHVISVPATYVIDRNGTIVFAYASHDYKVRTSPDEVIQVLKNMNS